MSRLNDDSVYQKLLALGQMC